MRREIDNALNNTREGKQFWLLRPRQVSERFYGLYIGSSYKYHTYLPEVRAESEYVVNLIHHPISHATTGIIQSDVREPYK